MSVPMEEELSAASAAPTASATEADTFATRPAPGPAEYSNFVENPWAMPMTREMHEAHERGMGTLRSANMGGDDRKRSELVRAAMPDTLRVTRTAPGEELHSRNTREGVHGAWSSKDRLSQEEAISQHALAWPGQVDDGTSTRAATRQEQHAHATNWVSVPGAERLESIAAPQMHPDGSLLEGGGRQIWHPGAGGHGRNATATWGGLGAEEIRKGTVANRVAGYEAMASAAQEPIWKRMRS